VLHNNHFKHRLIQCIVVVSSQGGRGKYCKFLYVLNFLLLCLLLTLEVLKFLFPPLTLLFFFN
jgi:hypothetical protein